MPVSSAVWISRTCRDVEKPRSESDTDLRGAVVLSLLQRSGKTFAGRFCRLDINSKPKDQDMSDSASYEYTAQGWLKKVTFANGTTVEYFYDDNGNRTSVVTTCSGGGC
ncbi:MAG: RHS repeat domain-containing protein [Candidatus Obscuribacterales bacterium]